MLTLALFSCAGPITNEFLLEDQEFLNALPQREQHLILLSAEETTAVNDVQATAETFNATFDELLGWVDSVRGMPPTEREEDLRIWGPHLADESGSLYWQVDIERIEPGRFQWVFALRSGTSGAWVTFFEGDYLAGFDAAESAGGFRYDLDRLSDMGASEERGSILVEYDYIGEHELYADLTQDGVSGEYWYREQDGVASAWFVLPYEIYYEPGEDKKEENIPELYAIAAQWLSTGAGRTDTHISEGNLAPYTAETTECWDDLGETVYTSLSLAGIPQSAEGSSSDCAFREGLDPLDPPD